MSLTLGEKLRAAREERGFSISEVSEQTRISSLYLQSIEHDDYRILPGGIFNKGFVKSYAKFVGLNEQEALADYSRLLSETAASDEAELKLYKPEVLTDDRIGASMIPTIIIAVVILGLMSGGVLFLVKYLREQPSAPPVANLNTKTPEASPTELPSNSKTETLPTDAPDMATLKVEFRALSQPVSLTATSDGKSSSNVIVPIPGCESTRLRGTPDFSLATLVAHQAGQRFAGTPRIGPTARRNSPRAHARSANCDRRRPAR